MMDKINPKNIDQLLSHQVNEAQYFFLQLSPARQPLSLAFGGRERCNPDYSIQRRGYAYFGIEYVAEGIGELRLGAQHYPLSAGSLFAYAPTMPCVLRTHPEHPMLKYFVCLSGHHAAQRLASAGIHPGEMRQLTVHAEIRGLAEELLREGQRTGKLTRRICAGLFELLLLKIENAFTAPARGTLSEEQFHHCKALIDADAERLMTLQEIADSVGIQAPRLCRLFRQYHDTSPYQYLLRKKMNIAAAFLMEQRGRVADAALSVGFSDPYHFSRCFKSIHGIAPSTLRHLS